MVRFPRRGGSRGTVVEVGLSVLKKAVDFIWKIYFPLAATWS